MKTPSFNQPTPIFVDRFRDELEDEGQSILHKIGLTCTSLTLQGGHQSLTYQTFARKSPHRMYVSEYGRVVFDGKNIKKEALPNAPGNKKKKNSTGYRFPKKYPHQDRYYTHLKSLFSGDFFLYPSLESTSKKPNLQKLHSIAQSLLPDTLGRLRLSLKESTQAYTRIEDLCQSLLTSNKNDEERVTIQQVQLIALMGLWNFTRDVQAYSKAQGLAEDLINDEKQSLGKLTAHFFLAQNHLKLKKGNPKDIIEAFVQTCNKIGNDPFIYASASVLALFANDLDLHEKFREQLLKSASSTPQSVVTFLKNRRHRHYLFKADISSTSMDRYDRYRERRYIINNAVDLPSKPFPQFSFNGIDGKKIQLPQDPKGKLTLMMFLDAPANGNIMLNPKIYTLPPLEVIEDAKRREAARLAEQAKTKKKSKRIHIPKASGVLNEIFSLADKHINDEVGVVLVFLGGELEQIRGIKKRYRLDAQVAFAPEGLKHPSVHPLGLYCTDIFPNTFLIDRKGFYSWHVTGMPYRVEPTDLMRSTELSLRNHFFRYDLEAGYEALKKGNYERAKQLFSGPYPSEGRVDQLDNWRQDGGKSEFHKWTPSQHHGLAKTLIALGEWEEALKAIEKAKDEHLVYFREDDDKPSISGIALHRTHGKILEELGRITEARTMKNKASRPPTTYRATSLKKFGDNDAYHAYEEKLHKLIISPPKN